MGTTGPFPMPMAMPTLVFPSDPPPVWIPSPRGLTQWPRELFRLPTTTARGPLTPTLPLLPPFPLETRLAWTPSPRALMSPPRDTFPMPMVSTDTISATTDTTTARGLHAEADPYYLGGYAVAGLPVGDPSGLDPITQGLDASTQGHPYAYGHLGYYGHHLGYLGHYYG